MNIRLLWSSVLLGGVALSASGWAAGEADIDSLRPVVLYEEGFESGRAESKLGGAEIESVEGSQQLVVGTGSFEWASPEIALNEPLLTRAGIDVLAKAGPNGFQTGDHVRVYAQVSDDQEALHPLVDLHLGAVSETDGEVRYRGRLPLGALADRERVVISNAEGFYESEYWAGIVLKPQWLKLVIETTIVSTGTSVAFDNLELKEERAVLDESAWRNFGDLRSFSNFSVRQVETIDPETPEHGIEVMMSLSDEEWDVIKARLEEESLVLGTTNYFEVQKLHLVEFEEFSQTPNGSGLVRFRMQRPADGWRSLTDAPALFFLAPDGTTERFDPRRLRTRWQQPPWKTEQEPVRPPVWSNDDDGEFLYSGRVVLEPDSITPVTDDAEFVDFVLRADSSVPYDLGDPSEFIVQVRIGRIGGEKRYAEFLGIQEVTNDGLSVRMNYRLRRPSYGWPAEKMWVTVDTGRRDMRQAAFDGTNNFLPGVVGKSEVRVMIPEAETGGPQLVSVSDESFTIQVDCVSDSVIAIDSIGDGDLVLRGNPVQDGRLVSTEVFEAGKRVRATFAFDWDPRAYTRWYRPWPVDIGFPNGAAQDVDGNTTFGLSGDDEFAPVLVGLNETVSANMVPLSRMALGLEAFRFRVLYESAEAPLRESDLQGNHLSISADPNAQPDTIFYLSRGESAEEWYPTVTSVLAYDNGRQLAVDYRWDRPESGWPAVSRLQLFAGSLRDENGGSLGSQDLGTVGRTDLVDPDIDLQLIGGRLIEGDPEMHRLSFLAHYNGNGQSVWSNSNVSPFAGASVWLGLNPGPMPVFAEDMPEPAVGTEVGVFRNLIYDSQVSYDDYFKSLVDLSNPTPEELAGFESLQALDAAQNLGVLKSAKTVFHVDIPRPPEGWETWDVGRVPYLLQVPGLEGVPSSFVASGYLNLADCAETLPLLFSFEEWARQLEERAELPEVSLRDDVDGDGQDGLTEFALGSDLLDGAEVAAIRPEVIKKDGRSHLQLEFNLRREAFGLTAELQFSANADEWRSVDDDFEVVERVPQANGVTKLRLVSKEAIVADAHCGFFRIAVAR